MKRTEKLTNAMTLSITEGIPAAGMVDKKE